MTTLAHPRAPEAEEPVKERGWRNVWMVPKEAENIEGKVFGHGVHYGRTLYPTWNAAVDAAKQIMEQNAKAFPADWCPEYLGPEEAP
jgi:hypothetical protein